LNSSDDQAVKAASQKINQQTIFAKPTIEQLSSLLAQLCANGQFFSPAESRNSALDSVRAMIKKYESDWDNKKRQLEARAAPPKERIVITGTTGALGSYFLGLLLESDRVEKVWALNRKSKGIEERQRASFEDKMLDVSLLMDGKLVLLEADLEDGKLGLETEVYDEVSFSISVGKAYAF
jgi:hypothetical protein